MKIGTWDPIWIREGSCLQHNTRSLVKLKNKNKKELVKY